MGDPDADFYLGDDEPRTNELEEEANRAVEGETGPLSWDPESPNDQVAPEAAWPDAFDGAVDGVGAMQMEDEEEEKKKEESKEYDGAPVASSRNNSFKEKAVRRVDSRDNVLQPNNDTSGKVPSRPSSDKSTARSKGKPPQSSVRSSATSGDDSKVVTNVKAGSRTWKESSEQGIADEAEAILAAQLAADLDREKRNEWALEEKHFALAGAAGAINARAALQNGKLPDATSGKADSLELAGGDEMLATLLDEKDKQIETLQSQLMQAVRGDAGVVASLDATAVVDKRDAKIVSLAKKNRSLHLALEREKETSRKLRQELDGQQKKDSLVRSRAAFEKARDSSKPSSSGSGNTSGRESQGSQGVSSGGPSVAESEALVRASEMESRASDLRRKLERANWENKRLKRLLTQEVGEGPALDKLFSDLYQSQVGAEEAQPIGSSWRGRAQKILLLQSKLKRAHAQLERLEQGGTALPSEDDESLFQQEDEPEAAGLSLPSVTKNKGGRRSVDVDAKAEADVKVIERERRLGMEKLADEYEQLEAAYTESKRAMAAAKARISVVETENKRYKEQLKVLLSKSQNDDALVQALRTESDRAKRESSELRDRLRNSEKSDSTTQAYEELKQHAMSQSAQIERQGQLLVKMRSELERVKSSAARDVVERSHEDIDQSAQNVSNKLLKVENDRLGELVELFKKKLERAVLDRESTLTKCNTLERQKIELERTLGNVRAGGKKRPPMADQLYDLRDKLALQIEENRALRASASMTISQKDEEIKILRDMGVEVKAAYEKAIEEMKRQVAASSVDAQKRMLHSTSPSKVDDALLNQLTRDNEYLRVELNDMRHRRSPLGSVSSPANSRGVSTLESPTLKNRKFQHVSPRIVNR